MMLFALCLISLVLACERKSREIGQNGKALKFFSPSYSVTPNVSTVSGVSYIQEVSPKGSGGPVDGKALFEKNCLACHQMNGQGIPGAFPPLDGSSYVTSDKIDRLASIMLFGLTGPITVNGIVYSNVMTPFGGQLKDEELAAIATYVRGSWSNKVGPVDAKVFAQMRGKWGTHGPFTIAELGEETS